MKQDPGYLYLQNGYGHVQHVLSRRREWLILLASQRYRSTVLNVGNEVNTALLGIFDPLPIVDCPIWSM